MICFSFSDKQRFMRKKIYVILKDVEEYLTAFYRREKREVTFADAVVALYENGKYYTSPFEEPNYEDCAGDMSIEDFRALVSRSNIDVTDLIACPSSYQKNMHMENLSFFNKDVYTIFTPVHEAHHIHNVDCFEISIVLDGHCSLQLNNDFRVLEKGQAIFFSPNTDHDLYAEEGSLMLTLLIKKSTFKNAFQNILESDSVMADFFNHSLYHSAENYLLFITDLGLNMKSAMLHILSESMKNDSYARSQCNLYVSVLLGEILRNYSQTYTYFSSDHMANYNIPLILTYIKANLTHVTMEEVAKFFGYNKDYMGKLIYRSTGRYYTDIVNTYRIDKARGLLQYSGKTIAAIAEDCGYHTVYHFNRTFKKIMHMSAAEYRRKK